MDEIVTLDMAEDAFGSNPNAETAAVLLETATEYETDGMIGPSELSAIRAKVADYLPSA